MYYHLLDLPGPKIDNFESLKGDPIIDTQWYPKFLEKKAHLLTNGTELAAARYQRWSFNSDIVQQYLDSVIPELSSITNNLGYQVITNDKHHPNGAQMAPHIDGWRGNYVLQYILDPGGPEAFTKWVHDLDHPVIREQIEDTQWFFGQRNFHILEQPIQPCNTWAIIRSDILHAVEIITDTRISITAGFHADENFIQNLVKKYSISY